MLMKSVIGVLAGLLLSGAAAAQTVFPVVLTPGQAVPPNFGENEGSGLLIYDRTTKMLKYDITVSGVSGTLLAATLSRGVPGVAGSTVFSLTGGPAVFKGAGGPLSPSDESLLDSGALHILLTSSGFPQGDARGQVTSTGRQLMALADTAQAVPPAAGVGTGRGSLTINNNNTVSYSFTATGLSGPATGAEIRAGLPGQNGAVITGLLSSGLDTFDGTTGTIGDLDLARIRAGHAYVSVSTAGVASEIRGQLVASFVEYGRFCEGALELPMVTASGFPTPGDTLTINIRDGVTFGSGILLIGSAGTDLNFGYKCRLFVGPPLGVVSIAQLDVAGNLSFRGVVPPVAVLPQWAHLQFFGADPSYKTGFYNTNGLGIQVN